MLLDRRGPQNPTQQPCTTQRAADPHRRNPLKAGSRRATEATPPSTSPKRTKGHGTAPPGTSPGQTSEVGLNVRELVNGICDYTNLKYSHFLYVSFIFTNSYKIKLHSYGINVNRKLNLLRGVPASEGPTHPDCFLGDRRRFGRVPIAPGARGFGLPRGRIEKISICYTVSGISNRLRIGTAYRPAARIASTIPLSCAMPCPAISNAVPWSTDVRKNCKPIVRLTVP